MEKANTVKILEVYKVSPWSNSPNSQSRSSLALTPFDWTFLKFPPTERILFYPLTDLDPPFFDSILPKLKCSLSLTLQHFLPLAGNLIWPDDSPKPFILYTPTDAISLTVAEINSNFNYVSDNHAREINEFCPLLPTIQSFDTHVPVMAVQVTKFQNDGFSIGVASHHVLCDGKSMSMFLKAWAYICKVNQLMDENQLESFPLLPELAPSFERGTALQTPFDFIPKGKSLKFNSCSSVPSNWFHATFELTRANIEELKRRVLDPMEKSLSQGLHLSAFVVVYAYTLICLAKAKQAESEESFCIVLTVDARQLLDPPLSSNYFGNCLSFDGELGKGREFTEEGGFLNIVQKISNLILRLKSNVNKVPRPSTSQQNNPSGIKICSVASSPKFKFYEADFGWGKPKKIKIVSLGDNNISLTEARDGGGGVEVGVVLPSHQMDMFASIFSNGLN